jgi:hypothetical protein
MSGNRQNQIGWQQFSLRHRNIESTHDDSLDETRDKHDDTLEIHTSTPKSKTRTVQKRTTTPRKTRVQKPITPETETHITENSREHVQKPKTRAARREIEDEITETPPIESTKPKHRERRSDYWVQRDDKRRTAARTIKFQEQAE